MLLEAYRKKNIHKLFNECKRNERLRKQLFQLYSSKIKILSSVSVSSYQSEHSFEDIGLEQARFLLVCTIIFIIIVIILLYLQYYY